ncbi:MAG: hypothetical protein H6751_11390 [Candidatus Omnitrophica bacterium]|nr:hypothetical protein [Candidatus Omnitrophota bacterium]
MYLFLDGENRRNRPSTGINVGDGSVHQLGFDYNPDEGSFGRVTIYVDGIPASSIDIDSALRNDTINLTHLGFFALVHSSGSGPVVWCADNLAFPAELVAPPTPTPPRLLDRQPSRWFNGARISIRTRAGLESTTGESLPPARSPSRTMGIEPPTTRESPLARWAVGSSDRVSRTITGK